MSHIQNCRPVFATYVPCSFLSHKFHGAGFVELRPLFRRFPEERLLLNSNLQISFTILGCNTTARRRDAKRPSVTYRTGSYTVPEKRRVHAYSSCLCWPIKSDVTLKIRLPCGGTDICGEHLILAHELKHCSLGAWARKVVKACLESGCFRKGACTSDAHGACAR